MSLKPPTCGQTKNADNTTAKSAKSSENSALNLSYQQAANLGIGDKIDHRDSQGRWRSATIENVVATKIYLHYDGSEDDKPNDTQWKWSDFSKHLNKFAEYKSISHRSAHRFEYLKQGDPIVVNASYRGYPGWSIGEIIYRSVI